LNGRVIVPRSTKECAAEIELGANGPNLTINVHSPNHSNKSSLNTNTYAHKADT